MKKDSRRIVFVMLAVIGLLTVLIGSYALFEINLAGNKKYVITAGSLQLELEEKDGITLSNALPVYDEVGMLGEPYVFTLRNSSDFLIKYELELVDETNGDEVLAYEDLRYGLTKNGVTTYGSIAELENMIIDAGTIGAGSAINYEFRMWINYEVTDDTRLNGKTRTFKINIKAATSDDDVILAATLDGEALAEFPTREDNYGVESIKCTDDLSASFDPTTWSVTVDGITKSNTSCVVNFSSDITLDETDEALTMSKSELYDFYKGTFSGTATSDEVLSGKTVYINGVETTGTMPNNGSVTTTLNAGETYTIPAGYHNGSGKVAVNSLASQTSATAVAADIASGKTAWVNGVKVTGTSSGVSLGTASLVKSTKTYGSSSSTYTATEAGKYLVIAYIGGTSESQNSSASTTGTNLFSVNHRDSTYYQSAASVLIAQLSVNQTITGTTAGGTSRGYIAIYKLS